MLDEKFLTRMKSILPENEYENFCEALSDEPVRALRVNTLKTSVSDFLENEGLAKTPLSYCKEGFIFDKAAIGSHPAHHAGLIYVQDPGAMSALSALDIKPGWAVLDACSAPGGKSTQAAAKIGDAGFILSNEFVPKRAKTVVSNFERLGVRCGVVTSLDTAELPKMFRAIFDLVIADVPCSGEGMFRKSDEALSEWSEENVCSCQRRQLDIMKNLPSLVKPGGYLLYSTCTYSLLENEMVVDAFLKDNPDFSLERVPKELEEVTADGINFEGAYTKNLNLARRFYPHKSEGEGQFLALMKRRSDIEDEPRFFYKDAAQKLSKKDEELVLKFFRENLKKIPDGRLGRVSDNIVLISHGYPIPEKSVFSAGVLVGTVEKDRLVPSHQFFSAYGDLFLRQENLKRDDARLAKYLSGEEIDARDFSDSGWCSVLYSGVALGGGKASLCKIKNHYPKGLRNK